MAAKKNVDTESLGQFHPKYSKVTLSKDRRIANGSPSGSFSVVFSNDPISIGQNFSVKILQKSSRWSLVIGVTTNNPDTGPLPQRWSDILNSDQYWRVVPRNRDCIARHKGQERVLQRALVDSAGNTFGCCVSNKGELLLYHNGRDVGVVWEGLPTDQSLWGIVGIRDWKVEAKYILPKESPSSPCPSIGPVSTSPEPKEVGPSSTGHPQDYTGKAFHFVERPPEWLICAVCQALAQDPVQANCCGNVYCTRCIERWRTRSNSCLTCRSTEQSDPPFNVFRDRNAHRHITSLTVYCPNWKDGCSKTMDLSDVEKHLSSDNGCSFHVVECGNKCGHKERRATVKKHMTNECRLRREKCKYCLLVSTHEEVTGTHLEVCPNYPLHCPNRCGAEGITSSTVSAHREVCPLQRVECEYKRFGCTVVLPRKDIAEHLKTSVESHLQMTKRRVEEQEVCLKEQEVRLKEQEVCLKEQEVHLKEQEVHLKEQEVRLKEQEMQLKDEMERAEKERYEHQALREKVDTQELRLQKMESILTHMGWNVAS